MTQTLNTKDEWLEADGLGGFSSGTASGIRTRRYHALLLAATTPPTGRVVLVNGFDALVETPAGSYPISSQHYAPDTIHPDGARRIDSFTIDPWPCWRYLLDDGNHVEQEIVVRKGSPLVCVMWKLGKKRPNVRLVFRPLISGRDYHALLRENAAFRFEEERDGGRIVWRPYQGIPGIVSLTNAEYVPQPEWYRNFLYAEERARGLDCTEDLASPGFFRWDLSRGAAWWMLAVPGEDNAFLDAEIKGMHAAERRLRGRFPSVRHRSADAYVVRRGEGKSIIAGYPWFTDWGRDTFIALRGLCLVTGKIDVARDMLLTWAAAVSEGMLPNRFPDSGETPEYNAVDASLWFVIAVHDLMRAAATSKRRVTRRDQKTLWDAVDAILDGYARGTRFGIRADHDGLLAAGEPNVQLTWMDAKIDGQVITPRLGKPVEIQALWLNALWVRSSAAERWADWYKRGVESFQARFWNEEAGCLFDVIDVAFQAGTADNTVRPNQIFAVGGLPIPILEGAKARRVVDTVEQRLLTPLGLRSLAPGEPGYRPRCEGGPRERDLAYHEGTVWPWLIGPFVEAWVRVRGETPAAKRDARQRFLTPLLEHLDQYGLGHVSEIADGDPPHTPRGCPFQAWSLGEILRLDQQVLAD